MATEMLAAGIPIPAVAVGLDPFALRVTI